MTNHQPRHDHWATRIVTAIFLLFLGGLINQFLNIPAQQAEMRARLEMIVQQQKTTDERVQELSDRLDDHDRRTGKHGPRIGIAH